MTCRKYKLLFFSLAIASLFILAPDINAGQASILSTSQTKNTLVKGTVKDASGEPLIGVSVSVKASRESEQLQTSTATSPFNVTPMIH